MELCAGFISALVSGSLLCSSDLKLSFFNCSSNVCSGMLGLLAFWFRFEDTWSNDAKAGRPKTSLDRRFEVVIRLARGRTSRTLCNR